MARARATASCSAARVLAMVVVEVWSILRSVEAAKYTVGDATGWSNVANGASFYSSWASGQTFNVNDTLVFNFVSGKHDVALVSEADFSSCNKASPITLWSNPPVNYTLNTTKAVHFICTFDSHCSQGQKLSVTVGTASGPSSSSSPPGTPSPPSPPPASSGTGYKYVSCRVMFTSMAIYLLLNAVGAPVLID